LAFVPQQKNVQVVEASPDRLNVSGALTFETARSAYEAGVRTIRNGSAGSARSPLQIDCEGVTESDSAGLAVLIEWLADGTKLGRKIAFANLPDGIKAAAQISDATAILEAGA
jgi:phospholipid transport system transporter-binding protein